MMQAPVHDAHRDLAPLERLKHCYAEGALQQCQGHRTGVAKLGERFRCCADLPAHKRRQRRAARALPSRLPLALKFLVTAPS